MTPTFSRSPLSGQLETHLKNYFCMAGFRRQGETDHGWVSGLPRGQSRVRKVISRKREEMGLREDIEEARKVLGLPESSFREARHYVYHGILKEIWCRFTKLGHKAESHVWINHHLEGQVVGYQPNSEDEATRILCEILPQDEELWFIGSETRNEQPKYWLYETTADAIVKVLNEMYLFDYYVVNKKFQWLLSEEHHGLLLAVGEPVASKLKKFQSVGDG